jgi:NADH-quinone oxidoreductase subunit F
MGKTLLIKVCTGTGGISDHGHEVFASFQESLSGLKEGHSQFERLKLYEVGCKGFCASDVLVDVVLDGNKTTYMGVVPDMVERIMQEHVLGGIPVAEWTVGEGYSLFQRNQTKVVLTNCGEIDPEDIDAYIEAGGYEAARKAVVSMQPKEIVEQIKSSNLRGRGGAGFPTGLKWEISLRSRGDVKYVICNGDEGDPGAFMDRSIMEGDPHAVIEGMIICARAVGAQKGYLYVRAEYPLALRRLRLALEKCYQAGLLGKSLFESGFDFDLRIFQGAGAFVCGEATALLRSIEGRRGMPTPRLTRSAEKGLWERPTVLNNVETFANVPQIILKGSTWFKNLGTDRSGGTKVFSLSGKVKNTGLIEVPLGIPLREIIYDIGGGVEGISGFNASRSIFLIQRSTMNHLPRPGP